MNNVEAKLDDMKNKVDNIQVPHELESNLRQSLDRVPNKKKGFNYRNMILAATIAIFFIGYNVDALAYYGKKIIGYDIVMNGTLKDLNRLEKGQTIDKSYEFKNGSKLTLDGIMLDSNNLVMFYTVFDPLGNVEEIYNDLGIFSLEGLISSYSGGGHGITSDDGKTMRWVYNYDSPKFFEKNMKFIFTSRSTGEEGKIEFKLDRNQAMTESLKLAINKKIEISDRKIKIDSLVASPITTVIKGQLQNLIQLGLDKINGERIYFESIDLMLIADGRILDKQSSGISSNIKGSSFDLTFDALPEDTKEIEIKLISFGVSEDVKEKIVLDKGTMNKTINILGQDIIINKAYEKDGNTYVNITTEENVYLTSLYLNISGKEPSDKEDRISNQRTIDETYDKTVGKDGKDCILRTRTVEFEGAGENLELDIKKISYQKDYDKVIYNHRLD